MRHAGFDDHHVAGSDASLRSAVDSSSVGLAGPDALRIDDLSSEQEGRLAALYDHDVGVLIVDLYRAVFVASFGGEHVVVRRGVFRSLFGSDALLPDTDSGRKVGGTSLKYPCCEKQANG